MENSVENVEKGFEKGRRVRVDKVEKTTDLLGSFRGGLLCRAKKYIKKINFTGNNTLIYTNRKKFSESYCKLKKTL